ncbi:hypothetical protein FPV67DRAFT_1430111 [Lyophyllum atratum]|nr:hypothetical protein FPV67DRAFT_1430111 [Lyophyllum atratum]
MTRSPPSLLKAAASKGKAISKRKHKTSLSTPTLPTIGALTAAQSAAREQYAQPKTTKDSYKGHLNRGFQFLAALVKERQDKKIVDEMDTDVLKKAFSNPPNRYTLFALEAYLTHRCFNEGLGLSTANCIQGAFTHYWDNMGDGRWSGDSYKYRKKSESVHGNPARATSFKAIIRSVANRKKADGSPRNHAEPLDLNAMKKSMDWSERQYGSEALRVLPKDEKEKALALKHALGRAIFTFGFNVWTRNFELTGVRVRDITRSCADMDHHPYLMVFLDRRKGWLNKAADNGPLQSKRYKIYKQDIEEIDLYTHLLRYMDYVERTIGRALAPDEFLFPYISSNGAIHLNREMSHDMVQNLIDEFTGDLAKRYTTHCFRRGGAQYRFMYAPLGQRWSLTAVRWWGGWAEGESVDMLVKYLLDAVEKDELDHSDQLCPSRLQRANRRFMSEHALVAPATVHDLNAMSSKLLAAVQKPLTNQGYASPRHPGDLEPWSVSSTSPSPISTLPDHSIANGLTSPSGIPHHSQPPSFGSATSSPNRHSAEMPSPSLPAVQTTSLASIPDLGHGKKGKGVWRKAIAQWDGVDPQTGLALKDWPDAWFTGDMKNVCGVKRRTRQVVWEERQRLGGTNEAFLTAHPEADSIPFRDLVTKISQKNGALSRVSKNGTPEARRLHCR